MNGVWKRVNNKFHDGRVVLLDGGIGANVSDHHLHDSGFVFPWSVDGLVVRPADLVRHHRDYIKSGCDIITANAFRTNRRALQEEFSNRLAKRLELKKSDNNDLYEILNELADDWGRLAGSLTQVALFLANVARLHEQTQSVSIAGNFTTLCDCYCPDLVPDNHVLEKAHRERVEQLSTRPDLIDLFLIETINTAREGCVAARAALESPIDRPVWVAFVLDREGKARLYRSARRDAATGELVKHPETGQLIEGDAESGESLSDLIPQLIEVRGPDHKQHNRIGAVLFNCTTPTAITYALEDLNTSGRMDLLRKSGVYVGAYANAEMKDDHTGMWARPEDYTHEDYAQQAIRWVDLGAQIIGGCCGTRPLDLMQIRRELDARGL